jgi:hypothetical protein
VYGYDQRHPYPVDGISLDIAFPTVKTWLILNVGDLSPMHYIQDIVRAD